MDIRSPVRQIKNVWKGIPALQGAGSHLKMEGQRIPTQSR